ncbi:MAG: hypothetical protein A2277_15900 [Desulfobacterales bacterium RIFOXYA12_FULL_46_15]|nr:MAG: hypothetical protein A2277_15900 [Desulfobacterales bacterium RIFOXYA12_FULL_46_15]
MNRDGHDPLDAMSSEFIAEIKDDLASLEPALLAMEKKGAGTDDDLINHAFRSIHSIKGGAGFINFKELSNLSHAMENVLMRVREKTLAINSDIVDALLTGFDKMKLMVEQIGKGETCDYEKEKTALQKILNPDTGISKPGKHAGLTEKQGKKPGESAKPVNSRQKKKSRPISKEIWDDPVEVVKPLGISPVFQGKEFMVDKKRLDHALSSQKFIYAVYIRFEADLRAKNKDKESIVDDIKSIGDILFSDLEQSRGQKERDGFFCVISTILDLPLLSQVLEIAKTQMTLVDRQFTDYETLMKGVASRAAKDKPEPVPKPVKTSITEPDDTLVRGTSEFSPDSFSSTHTLRINVDLISRLMNRAGELVLARNQLRPFLTSNAKENSLASGIMQNLDMVTTDIQQAIMQMRMQPVIDLLGKYKRVVRDIARRISKKVDFILEGADVELDRTILEKLANPVTHLIRNCIDHGIESPEERVRKSKPETGTIRIKASHQGGQVHITLSDDGAGIDPQLILSKAFEKGLVSEDRLDKMTDKQKIDLIFLPGFTTSEEITDISGRGVGMDVVKTNIESLRGRIEIDSVKGEGTTVHLIIPLTLAIVPSLIVSTGEFKFAIPQVSIKEVLYLEKGAVRNQVENIAGFEVLKLRGHIYPIVRLRNVLGIKTYIKRPVTGEKEEEKRKAIADRRQQADADSDLSERWQEKDRRTHHWDTTYVIILKHGENLFGLCTDELYDIEEIVVEPLSEYIRHLECFAGTTILGNGGVITVLDIQGIAALASLKFDSIRSEDAKRNLLKEKEERLKGEKRNLIIFTSGRREYFAMELKNISRLEPVNPKDIHYTGHLKHIEYKGHAVLLFSIDEFLPAVECDFTVKEIFAVFPKHLSARVGILTSGIIDTIETDMFIDEDESCPEPILGKLFIGDMMVQVIDHERFADLIEQKLMMTKGARASRENTDC